MENDTTIEFQSLNDFSLEKPKVKIFCFLKIGRREHMEALAKGDLYCRHLSFYSRAENKDKPFYDEHEGITQIFQAERASEVYLVTGEGKRIDLPLAQKSQIRVSTLLSNPVFCLHALHTGNWDANEMTEDDIPAFKEHLQIPEDMDKFCDEEPWIWLPKNGNLFMEKVIAACKKIEIGMSADLVRYADLTKHHGQVPADRVGFIKQLRHKEEREYRIMFRSRNLPDPFRLSLGDMRENSTVMPLKEFRNHWQLEFKPHPELT